MPDPVVHRYKENLYKERRLRGFAVTSDTGGVCITGDSRSPRYDRDVEATVPPFARYVISTTQAQNSATPNQKILPRIKASYHQKCHLVEDRSQKYSYKSPLIGIISGQDAFFAHDERQRLTALDMTRHVTIDFVVDQPIYLRDCIIAELFSRLQLLKSPNDKKNYSVGLFSESAKH